jgi:hypothetical protein
MAGNALYKKAPTNALMEHKAFVKPSVTVNPRKLNALAAMTSPIPVLGDVMGLAADGAMYAKNPESRNYRNYLLSGLGVLPFIPAIASLGKATRNIPTGFGNQVGALGWDEIIARKRAAEGMQAAVRDPKTGKIYTGRTHQSAIDKAPKDDDAFDNAWGRMFHEWDKETDNVGFVDKAGNFMTRSDAEKSLGVTTAEDLRDLLWGRFK